MREGVQVGQKRLLDAAEITAFQGGHANGPGSAIVGHGDKGAIGPLLYRHFRHNGNAQAGAHPPSIRVARKQWSSRNRRNGWARSSLSTTLRFLARRCARGRMANSRSVRRLKVSTSWPRMRSEEHTSELQSRF